jgi:4-diphosphocytidyl-2-C-methyl-D-erythritol kinase
MRGSYRVVSASLDQVATLPEIERSAASLFGEDVPSKLLEITTPESVLFAAQRDGTLWVAVGSDDEPVGFARVTIEADRVHLAELDVLPSHGRRGIGTALVQTVETWARANDYSEITLTTYRDMPWNAPFYTGLGFVVVPQCDWDADLRGRFEQEAGLDSERTRRVVMRKCLGTA